MHKISIRELYHKMSLSFWHTHSPFDYRPVLPAAGSPSNGLAGTDSESSFGLLVRPKQMRRIRRKRSSADRPKYFNIHKKLLVLFAFYGNFLSIAINLVYDRTLRRPRGQEAVDSLDARLSTLSCPGWTRPLFERTELKHEFRILFEKNEPFSGAVIELSSSGTTKAVLLIV